jgi:hypothetical protein
MLTVLGGTTGQAIHTTVRLGVFQPGTTPLVFSTT